MRYTNKQEYLNFGSIYHIYNKAISSELLFRTDKDYHFFLHKFKNYILPFADVYAYCLIPNHFHLLIDIKPENDVNTDLLKRLSFGGRNPISQAFSNFFNSYSKSFNKVYHRKGRLFLYPFKRILVDNNDYLMILINYIHRNPIHHGITNGFSDWKYSSYNAILSDEHSNVKKDNVLALFGGKSNFIAFHESNKVKPGMEKYLLDE